MSSYPATPASLERTKARQYSETVPEPTGFGSLACIGADPLCPCQDGDACHYRDAADGTSAFPLPTDAGARMRQLWPPLFTPEEEAAIEAQYAQEEVIDQEEARSIAELAEDHHEQSLEMEADDDRAGFDPF